MSTCGSAPPAIAATSNGQCVHERRCGVGRRCGRHAGRRRPAGGRHGAAACGVSAALVLTAGLGRSRTRRSEEKGRRKSAPARGRADAERLGGGRNRRRQGRGAGSLAGDGFRCAGGRALGRQARRHRRPRLGRADESHWARESGGAGRALRRARLRLRRQRVARSRGVGTCPLRDWGGPVRLAGETAARHRRSDAAAGWFRGRLARPRPVVAAAPLGEEPAGVRAACRRPCDGSCGLRARGRRLPGPLRVRFGDLSPQRRARHAP